MADRIYIVDHLRLIKLSLPSFLRTSKTVAFLGALLDPVKVAYNSFFAYKEDAVYRVSHNGSVTLLQKVLNDKFDNVERRIYIKNVQLEQALRLYYRATDRDVGVFTPAQHGLRSALSGGIDLYDFTVHIPDVYEVVDPVALEKFLIQVRAQVDYYKLFAKKYTIEFYE